MDMDIDKFVERYVAVWNEPDPIARRRAISQLWDPDGVETTDSARYHGHAALDARITEAHTDLVRDAGFVFRSANDATGHHDTVTFTTHMIPAAGGDIAWSGRIFLTLGENGLIRHEYQFAMDTPTESKASTRATTEKFLRRLGEGDPDEIAELFAERVDWQLDWPGGGHPAVPWIRPRFTRADVADHFREIAAFHVPEKSAGTVSRVLIDGTEAVVLGDIRQTVKATGKPYTALCALHLTILDGLITRYSVYEDSLTVAESLSDQPVLPALTHRQAPLPVFER
ncbi:nuclear transport factor 2 family protein [Amycolatopsis sp. NPDC049253]|uniref:nuclear transport factor 2 family protein n=1 Tax=Amycolatopsis sp. NPDC049253 TaxID=3155274 RepID=UPI0034171715